MKRKTGKSVNLERSSDASTAKRTAARARQQVKASSKKQSRIRLGGNKYIWKTLSNVLSDADEDFFCTPLSPFYLDRRESLVRILRYQDIIGYLGWCGSVSLPALNEPDTNSTLSLKEIRYLRLLTLAEKYQFENSPHDTEANALAAFLLYEAVCVDINSRPVFSLYKEEVTSTYVNCVVHPALQFAEEFIHKVLEYKKVDYAALLSAARHGPGATAGKSGIEVLPVYKYFPPIDCTEPVKDLMVEAICFDQRWSRSLYQHARRQHRSTSIKKLVKSGPLAAPDIAREVLATCNFSRILFVPKNAVTRRTICAEPTGNMYLQLAVDTLIRPLLKKQGIDLNTQSKNQELALLGSLTGEVDTLDLKGASDCIATAWMKLFPAAWAKLITMLRVTHGQLPNGNVVEFSKLSAMGNGYTFVVESLIFSALVYGVAKVNGKSWSEILPFTSVYGDDIIVPKDLTYDLVQVLNAVGFLLNEDKSFTFGRIRESCGTDYIDGELITRPTFKSLPQHEWELVRDHNLLLLLSMDYGLKLTETLAQIISWIPRPHYGPVNRDQIYAWLFSEHPCVNGKRIMPSFSSKESLYWQSPVFKLKTYVVGYRKLHSNQQSLGADLFDPLTYLSKPGGNLPWWKNEEGFKIKTANESTLYFDKQKRVVRMSVTIIPEYCWPFGPQPLLEHVADI
jgi:hypothetical protein